VWDFARRLLLCSVSVTHLIRAVLRGNCEEGSNPATQPAPSADDIARKQKELGEIRRVAFVDYRTINWSCGSSLSSSNYGFHSETRILILFDSSVFFYDYSSGIPQEVSIVQLTKQPTSIEFICPDICGIGCNDGNIRFAAFPILAFVLIFVCSIAGYGTAKQKRSILKF
jgi:hypothetical protein